MLLFRGWGSRFCQAQGAVKRVKPRDLALVTSDWVRTVPQTCTCAVRSVVLSSKPMEAQPRHLTPSKQGISRATYRHSLALSGKGSCLLIRPWRADVLEDDAVLMLNRIA